MSSSLGPIEIHCDAPSYPIVKASRWLGMFSPEDVRWCRMSHFLQGENSPYDSHAWALFLEMGGAGKGSCSCGNVLPVMERCTFTFRNGRESNILLGQCERCRSIFWEEA